MNPNIDVNIKDEIQFIKTNKINNYYLNDLIINCFWKKPIDYASSRSIKKLFNS